MVFSTVADGDLGVPNEGLPSAGGTFQGGVTNLQLADVTPDPNGNPSSMGRSALVTMYEACWFTSWSTTFSQDAGMIMESGDVTISDVWDYSSTYGEFLATGNDPSIGQLGSIRYDEVF